MADKQPSKPAAPAAAAAAAEPPKPVQIGGESLLDRIRPYLKQIIIGLCVVIAIVVVFTVIGMIRQWKQHQSTDGLGKVLELARQPIRGKDEKPDPKKPSFASEKERALAVLALPGAESASPMLRGGMLLDAGKPDEAAAEYRKGATGTTIDAVMCREGVGLALEAKAAAEKDPGARQKGLEETLAAFAAMQPDEAGPRRAQALYHQGRIQVLLGKRAEARALFEAAKLANKDGDREIADLIEKRLAALGAS